MRSAWFWKQNKLIFNSIDRNKICQQKFFLKSKFYFLPGRMSEVWWGRLLGKCLLDEKFFLVSAGSRTERNINFEEFLKIFKLIRCTLLKWMHKSTILHWRLRFYWDAALVSFQMLNFSHHSIFPNIKLSWRTKFKAGSDS